MNVQLLSLRGRRNATGDSKLAALTPTQFLERLCRLSQICSKPFLGLSCTLFASSCLVSPLNAHPVRATQASNPSVIEQMIWRD